MGFLDDLTSDLQIHLDTNQATKDFSQDIPIVDLETFLYHEDYLKIPFRISDKQLDFLKSMDDNFEDIGTSKYNLAMLVWGKGSGKDFISGVLALRTIYKLLCYADPRETFRRTSGGKISIAPGDQISILNVAVNAEQAKGVYFDKLCGLVKNAGDKAFKRFGFDFDRDVKSGKILFPKELVIVSGHSRQEAMEGRNLIMATLRKVLVICKLKLF